MSFLFRSPLSLFGGHKRAESGRAKVDLSNAERFEWQEVSCSVPWRSTLPDQLFGATSTLCGSKVYTFGGANGASFSEQLHILDLVQSKWETVDLPERTRRTDHAAFLWNEFIYIYSGWDERVITDIFRIDLQSLEAEFFDCYFEGIPKISLDFFSGSFCEPSKELVMFGGNLFSKLSSRTFCFRVDGHTFYEPTVKGNVPPARVRHCSCCVQNKVYFYGGEQGVEPFTDLHVLTVISGQYVWSQLAAPDNACLRSSDATLTAVEGRLFLLGGRTSEEAFIHSGAIFSLDERKWLEFNEGETELETNQVGIDKELPITSGHSIVCDGKSIMVFGGLRKSFRDYGHLAPASA